MGWSVARRSGRRRDKDRTPGGGDDTRHWGPPFVTGADGENLSAAYYHSANRGKRSIALDIASPEGGRAARDLIATADVVIGEFQGSAG
jgi:crotonobetainyl-CoA:carnitine CoA-transferase CaiB-like acyl-CoA transferase